MLDSNQLKKLMGDPAKTVETKVQQTFRKIKHVFTEGEYKKLYPSGSIPGVFYGTINVHKLKQGERLDELSLRPSKSAKYLTKLLSL